MPLIGDPDWKRTPVVAVSAKGGIGTVQKRESLGEFAPPDGWVMMSFELVQTRHDGDAYITATIVQSETINRTIKSQRSDIRGKAEGMLTQIYGKGNFEGELNTVYEVIESHTVKPDVLRYTATAKGHPIGEANNTSSVEGYYNVEVKYIGTSAQDVVDSVKALKSGDGNIVVDCVDAARINAVMSYTSDNFRSEGFDGGFPNFEESIKNGEHISGVVFIKSDAYEFHHAPFSEFGTIDRTNVEAMMKAAHDYAKSKGFVTGFPTFHRGPNDYGVLLFKPEIVEQRNIPVEDLHNPQNTRDLFVAVNRKAIQEGFAAAFPTFVKVIEGGVTYNKVAFIKSGYAQIREVFSRDLNLPKYERGLCPV